eukprot:2560919-Amphidinium_carterae.2
MSNKHANAMLRCTPAVCSMTQSLKPSSSGLAKTTLVTSDLWNCQTCHKFGVFHGARNGNESRPPAAR